MGLHHLRDQHHQNSQPRSMLGTAGTNVWQWTTQLNANCVVATALFPPERDDIFFCTIPRSPRITRRLAKTITPGDSRSAEPTTKLERRARARCFCTRNAAETPSATGMGLSASARNTCQKIIWKSERLKNSRRVWIFTTGDATAEERPLAVLLDGEFWAQSMTRLASADFADPSSATSSRRVCVDRRYRHHAPRPRTAV